jgi:hypothetical protein
MIFLALQFPSSTLQAFFDTEQTLKFPPSNPKEAFYISARQSFHYLPNDNQVAFAVKDGGSLVEIKMNRFFVLSLSLLLSSKRICCFFSSIPGSPCGITPTGPNWTIHWKFRFFLLLVS